VLATPKTCFKSLLATAITASFLFFPFAINLLNNALQSLFVSLAFKAQLPLYCKSGQ